MSKTTIQGEVTALNLTAEQFMEAIRERLAEYVGLMQECWGFVPALTVKVESRLMVTVDFDIKDLPHNGRRFFVNAENQDELTAEKIARFTVEEMYTHKATCSDCGDGKMPLPERIHAKNRKPADAIEQRLFPKLAKRTRKKIRN